MTRWYRSLIPGRMPLPLAWFVAFLAASVAFVSITLSFGGGIVIPLQAGDTIRFEQVRQGADSTRAHHFTVKGSDVEGNEVLMVDVNLDDGRFGSEPSGDAPDSDPPGCAPGSGAPGGPLDGYEITFPEPGTFIISDCVHPRSHGSARFVVTDTDGRGGRLIVTGAFVVEDDRFELSISQTRAQFGYPAGTRISSRSLVERLIIMGMIGSVFAAPAVAWAKRRRWWLWGIFGLVLGYVGLGLPILTSVTVVAAVLLAERPRPAPAEPEAEPESEAGDEGPPDDLSGPPTQDQRTLPPPPVPATPPRPRPARGRRRPRY